MPGSSYGTCSRHGREVVGQRKAIAVAMDWTDFDADASWHDRPYVLMMRLRNFSAALNARLDNRIQLTSDALAAYVEAVEAAFGAIVTAKASAASCATSASTLAPSAAPLRSERALNPHNEEGPERTPALPSESDRGWPYRDAFLIRRLCPWTAPTLPSIIKCGVRILIWIKGRGA